MNGPFPSSQGGFEWSVGVGGKARQMRGGVDLLDDELGEETELCLLVRDGVVEGNDALFYNGNAFGEEFVGKCSRANGVSEEAEAVGEFDRDSRRSCVSRVGSC
jgi:hypothetical protein